MHEHASQVQYQVHVDISILATATCTKLPMVFAIISVVDPFTVYTDMPTFQSLRGLMSTTPNCTKSNQ